MLTAERQYQPPCWQVRGTTSLVSVLEIAEEAAWISLDTIAWALREAEQVDDVFCCHFIGGLILLTRSGDQSLTQSARKYLASKGNKWLDVVSSRTSPLQTGTYTYAASKLRRAYRLYDGTQKAFLTALKPQKSGRYAREAILLQHFFKPTLDRQFYISSVPAAARCKHRIFHIVRGCTITSANFICATQSTIEGGCQRSFPSARLENVSLQLVVLSVVDSSPAFSRCRTITYREGPPYSWPHQTQLHDCERRAVRCRRFPDCFQPKSRRLPVSRWKQ